MNDCQGWAKNMVSIFIQLGLSQVVLRDQTDYYGYVAWGEYPHCFAAVLNQAGNNEKYIIYINLLSIS